VKKELIQSEDYIAEKLHEFGWQNVRPSELLPDKCDPISIPTLEKAIRRIGRSVESDETIGILTSRSFSPEGQGMDLKPLRTAFPIFSLYARTIPTLYTEEPINVSMIKLPSLLA